MPRFQFPRTRWSCANMRQLLPSTQVWRGAGPASALPPPAQPDIEAIDAVRFTPMGSASSMSWADSLQANYTDAICVLHRGRVVYERYLGVMRPQTAHMAFSVTKSYTGTLGMMLVQAGALDERTLVPRIIPELAGTAFADDTVRDVMDMRIGVAYSEDYTNPQAEVWQHTCAGGMFPPPPGYAGPTSFYRFLQTLRSRASIVATSFCKTENTDVLGWLIRRVTGQPLGQVLSERLWQPLGCEEDGYMLVDREGTEFAGGWLNATVRDMARFGECMQQGGAFNGRQVVPEAVVQDIRTQGDASAFTLSALWTLKGGACRNMWWILNNAHSA
jgi:CubicO group peptidase (beta-lactamase class C family)